MTLQTDPGWLPERNGCLTASRFKDAIAFLKNGKESEARCKYRMELVAERIAGYAIDRYVSPPMQRGLDLESAARDCYEETTGHLLGPARSFAHPTIEFLMATPDATLGDDIVVEFKVPQVHTYVSWIADGEIPESHIAQLACQLIVTGRHHAIFCAFCPEMPEVRRLFIRNYVLSDEDRDRYTVAAIKFLDEVDELFRRVTSAEVPEPELKVIA